MSRIKEDQTSYDALKSEIDGYDAKIKRAEEAARLKASTASSFPARPAAKVYPLPKRRYGKLTAFKGTLEIDGKAMDAEERAYRSGMFILASLGKLAGEEKQRSPGSGASRTVSALPQGAGRRRQHGGRLPGADRVRDRDHRSARGIRHVPA
jgi:hypothetical protein